MCVWCCVVSYWWENTPKHSPISANIQLYIATLTCNVKNIKWAAVITSVGGNSCLLLSITVRGILDSKGENKFTEETDLQGELWRGKKLAMAVHLVYRLLWHRKRMVKPHVLACSLWLGNVFYVSLLCVHSL